MSRVGFKSDQSLPPSHPGSLIGPVGGAAQALSLTVSHFLLHKMFFELQSHVYESHEILCLQLWTKAVLLDGPTSCLSACFPGLTLVKWHIGDCFGA